LNDFQKLNLHLLQKVSQQAIFAQRRGFCVHVTPRWNRAFTNKNCLSGTSKILMFPKFKVSVYADHKSEMFTQIRPKKGEKARLALRIDLFPRKTFRKQPKR
ncbi:MAG: hypothetical protein COA48_07885, partial [Cycloclasticus sp.]